jgi:zinc protease
MRALVALLLLAVGAAAARAGDEVQLPPVTRVTLDNGMRLVVAETHELPLVEFYVMLGAGAAQDPAGKEGLADLVAGTLTRGAGDLDAQAFARTVERLGGSIAAEAGTDGTIVDAEFLSEDFDRAVQLLRDVLRDPRLEKDEVRRAREEQLAGLVAALEEPSEIAERCYQAWVYGTYPYGRPQDGTRASVGDLDRGDVRDYWERWYAPNNAIVAVVGDVSAQTAVATLRRAFGDWPARPDAVPTRATPPAPVASERVLLVDKPDATQTQIRAGGIAMRRADPELLAANVANTMLGGGFTSKLVEELRVKRSLTYGANSGFAARLTGGDFRMATFTKSPTTDEALALLLQVEDQFRGATPDAKALAKAKAYLRGQFPLRVETPDALAARLAEIEFFDLPKDELSTYRSRVAAVTAAEAAAMAARWMPPPAHLAIVVVGPAASLRAPLEARYGAVQVTTPEGCDALAAPPAK